MLRINSGLVLGIACNMCPSRGFYKREADKLMITKCFNLDVCRYLYNDAAVMSIQETEVLTKSAYVLFYHKVIQLHSPPTLDMMMESAYWVNL